MRNMKGFIFTVDSIFALIVAVAAISILLFSVYTSTFSTQEPTSEALSIEQNLLQTPLSQITQGSQIAQFIHAGSTSQQYTWPQYGQNASISSSTSGFGPTAPLLLYSVSVPSAIYQQVAVADGIVAFTSTGSSGELYAVNATTGSFLFSTAVGGPFVTGPIIYNHMIITANTAGGITAFSESNTLLWSRSFAPTAPERPVLDIENGYLTYGGSLLYPNNGATAVPCPSLCYAFPLSYADGEFFQGVDGKPSVPDDGFLLGIGAPLASIWQYTFSQAKNASVPASLGNYLTDSVGSVAGAFLFNGMQVTTQSLSGDVQGGTAMQGVNWYVETSDALYEFTESGEEIFDSPTPVQSFNVTPTVTGSAVYSLVYGYNPSSSEYINNFMGFNPTTGATLWNMSLLYSYLGGFDLPSNVLGDIPIAYGNAYFADGNTLFAFGSCKGDGSASALKNIASLYLNGQGGCANLLLNQTYGMYQLGIFVNNTYGPGLSVASFSPASGGYVEIPSPLHSNFQTNRVSISFWLYANSSYSTDEAMVGFENVCPFLGYMGAGNSIVFESRPHSDEVSAAYNSMFGRWISVVMEDNDTNATIYLDGAEAASHNGGASLGPCASGAPLYFSDPTSTFNGMMADVQIYNSVLTQAQATMLYQEGIAAPPVQTSNVIGWWPLEGDANDYSHSFDGYFFGGEYMNANFTPVTLQDAYQVSRASVPLAIYANGVYRTYNISTVVWR